MHADTTAGSNETAPRTDAEPTPRLFPTLAEIERQIIEGRLNAFRGNKKRAADSLGISRSTLHDKLNEWQAADAKNVGGQGY